MATIKIKFRTSSVKTKEGVLFYQIIHARVTRQINTGYKIFPSEWDKHLACIILPDNNDIRSCANDRKLYLLMGGIRNSSIIFPEVKGLPECSSFEMIFFSLCMSSAIRLVS